MKEVAIIRCLSDLIKADNIIANKEIEFFEKNFKEINQTLSTIEKAKGISLQQAVEEYKKYPTVERMSLIKKLKDLSLSDGACSREEALLILAISYCLVNKTKNDCFVYSMPTPHIDFEDSQVVFIEPAEDSEVNSVIKIAYKSIANDFRIGGFDFIYIPEIAEQFRHTDQSLLEKVIRYLAPTLSDEETSNVKKELTNMTSRNFYKAILKDKLGLDLSITHPSILIKIGNSYVNGIKTTDFFIIKVGVDISKMGRQLIDDFLSYQYCPTITIKNYTLNTGDFIYTGFFKTIFDLVTYRKGQRCKITFRHNERDLIIDDDSQKKLELNPAELAIYQFLVEISSSKSKGLHLKGQHTLKRDEDLRRQFAEIYKIYKGHAPAHIPDITDKSTLKPYISKIRKAINNSPYLTEKSIFLPINVGNRLFVGVDSYLWEIKKQI